MPEKHEQLYCVKIRKLDSGMQSWREWSYLGDQGNALAVWHRQSDAGHFTKLDADKHGHAWNRYGWEIKYEAVEDKNNDRKTRATLHRVGAD